MGFGPLHTTRAARVCAPLIILIAVGCTDDLTVEPLSVIPSADILDGGAPGGNPHFFWLSPMVKKAEYGGLFDASVLDRTVVEVCEMKAGACTLVMTFGAAGQGAAELRIEGGDDDRHYHAVWHTKTANLDPARDYRVRVRVSNALLGHADIDVVRNGKDAKDVDQNKYVVLVNGSSLPIKFRIEVGAVSVQEVPAEGGDVELAGGQIQLHIPQGALAGSVAITAQPVAEFPRVNGVIPGTVFDFGPDGTQFMPTDTLPDGTPAPGVQLTLGFDPTEIPEEVRGALVIAKLIDGEWVEVNGSEVDLENGTVSAPISSFSTYSITARWPSAYVTLVYPPRVESFGSYSVSAWWGLTPIGSFTYMYASSFTLSAAGNVDSRGWWFANHNGQVNHSATLTWCLMHGEWYRVVTGYVWNPYYQTYTRVYGWRFAWSGWLCGPITVSGTTVVEQVPQTVRLQSNLELIIPHQGSAVLSASALDLRGYPVAHANLQWTSSHPGVASVSGSGVTAQVTALGAGTTRITAVLPSNGRQATTLVTVTQAPQCTVAPAGAIHNWRGDGDATDRIGGAHGALVNGVTFSGGRVNSAFDLDGIASYVDLGTGASLSGPTDFTIEGWIRTSTGKPQTIINQRDEDVEGEYIFKIGSNHNNFATVPGRLNFMVYNGDFQFDFFSNGRVDDGQWHHVAAVRHGEVGRIYIDGVLDATETGEVKELSGTIRTFIGMDWRSYSLQMERSVFKGQIDELSIYNRALTTAELQSIVNAGSHGLCK